MRHFPTILFFFKSINLNLCDHRYFSILCVIFDRVKRRTRKQQTEEPKIKANGGDLNARYSNSNLHRCLISYLLNHTKTKTHRLVYAFFCSFYLFEPSCFPISQSVIRNSSDFACSLFMTFLFFVCYVMFCVMHLV